MFANKINPETGNPVCVCGEDCLPDLSANGVVSGSKGLVILHNACIDAHNNQIKSGR